MPDPTWEISRFGGKYQKDQGFAWDPRLRQRGGTGLRQSSQGCRAQISSDHFGSRRATGQLAISAKSGSPIDQFAPSRMTRR